METIIRFFVIDKENFPYDKQYFKLLCQSIIIQL